MTVHVIGAGLAGLSAATALAAAGVAVEVSEAAPQAGGRCRSYADAATGLTIDNGNHLLLSGNAAALAYLDRIGAQGRVRGPASAAFPFVDLEAAIGAAGRRADSAVGQLVKSGVASGNVPAAHDRRPPGFTVRPNAGPVPWWVLAPSRRVPGTRAADYLALARLLAPSPAGATVADVVPTTGPLWDKLLEPVLLAALNTAPAGASAALAGAVMRGSLARGGDACRPLIAHPTLAAAFVDPALAFLAARGVPVHTRRLTGFAMRHADGPDHPTAAGERGSTRSPAENTSQISALAFGGETIPLALGDAVILAVTAPVAAGLTGRLTDGVDAPAALGLTGPTKFNPIVSLHFALVPPPGVPPILGVLGGTSEWIFAFPDRISVTISGADAVVDRDRADLAGAVWAEVCTALGLGDAPLPRWQVVKERRATFAATVAQDALRPPAATRWANLFLAGDWTQTGLPATIEGAVRSGETAAGLARRYLRL